jgi:hypothetical protein
MKLIRTLHPEVEIVDSATGIVEYIASDESLDSYREIIRADGWRFNAFVKNSPFVDSHDYSTIEKCLGKVIDFQVRAGQLVETVQWAIDVPENKLAQIGWKMTQAGYLKAVSVGFYPTRCLVPGDGREWQEQLSELGISAADAPRCIYVEQEQVELSCCIIGANPNALAKSYKAGALTDADLDTVYNFLQNDRKDNPLLPSLSPVEIRDSAQSAFDPALADWTTEQAQRQFLHNLERALRHTAQSA